MNISYNWLRELTDTDLAPRELAERLTMVGLAVDTVHEAGDDFVLEFDLTSNRPDCLSHLGVARELAVIERKSTRLPRAEFPVVERTANDTSVEIRDADLCPRYAARIVRGVRIAPSPAWLANRLRAIGQRPINNVADITNYVLHELGQPLHAFDFAKLSENRIIVRRARAGEKIRTLDGVERELDAEMLVIADVARAVAVAGVMGGEESEVSDATRDVLIESAYFEPESVRRTARALGLHTEASYRFERGVDYEGVLGVQERCVSLICEIAGGTATEDALDVYPNVIKPPSVSLRIARIEALTGLHVPDTEIARILKSLGFALRDGGEEIYSESGVRRNIRELAVVKVGAGESPDTTVSGRESITVISPTWRVDIEREEDLVEEVARHYGYDKIADELPSANVAGGHRAGDARRRAARRALTAYGFDEAISFSFITTAHDEQFEVLPSLLDAGRGNVEMVSLNNPIIESATRMRPTLLPGLLDAVRHNFNHGTRDVRLFEAGRVFVRYADLKIEVPDGLIDFLLCKQRLDLVANIEESLPEIAELLLNEGEEASNLRRKVLTLKEEREKFLSKSKLNIWGTPIHLPVEKESLALVMTGGATEEDRAGASRELDFYDLKGAVETIADAINVPALDFTTTEAKHLSSGQAARVSINNRIVGTLGRLSDEMAAAYKFRQPVFVAEVDLSALLATEESPARYRPLARFPSVMRDISLLIDRRVTFAEMRRAVIDLNLENLRTVALVDVYEGANVPEGKRSVTLRAEYRAMGRTLRDDEVSEMHERVVSLLKANFGGELRA